MRSLCSRILASRSPRNFYSTSFCNTKYINQNFKLKLFRSAWDLPNQQISHIDRSVFHGIEASLQDIKTLGDNSLCHGINLIQQHNLDLIIGLYTSWDDYETHNLQYKSVKEHLNQYRRQLQQIQSIQQQLATSSNSIKLSHINVHSGMDHFSENESCDFFNEAIVMEKDFGLTSILSHETHRGRILSNPFRTRFLLSRFPELHLTADFSHWFVVCERLLDVKPGSIDFDLMTECCRRTRHVHARVGTTQSAEVTDPMASTNRKELRIFDRLWDLIWDTHRQQGREFTSVTPEYGYYTGTSISQSNVINQGIRLRNRFLAQYSNQCYKQSFPAQPLSTLRMKAQHDLLPIIDIAPFIRSDSTLKERNDVAQAIHEACKSLGFFYITGHGISQQHCDEVIDCASNFFSLSDEAKDSISVKGSTNPRSGRGYQRLAENITYGSKDYHEAIDFYRELPADHHLLADLNTLPLHFEEKMRRQTVLASKNLWPQGKDGDKFKLVMENHKDRMLELGAAVMRAIALGLGLKETYFTDKYTNDSFWVMRVIGYPPLRQAKTEVNRLGEVGISCGEHCDYGCLTFITADETRGALQVKNTNQQWIAADPIQGTFVVNIGDMLSLWTGGLYKSTPHRVINNSSMYRVSVPLFYEPNFDAVIKPIGVIKNSSTAIRSGFNGNGMAESIAPVVYGDHLMSKVFNNFTF